jgi:hypothetical protein
MWLPKDERKVLALYYEKLHGSGVEARGQVFISELEKCLPGKDKRIRAKRASETLQKRNLLAFYNDQGDAITVQLSLEGFDLGRKYNFKRQTFLLWCNEYKVWIIVGLIISLVSVLVAILKN